MDESVTRTFSVGNDARGITFCTILVTKIRTKSYLTVNSHLIVSVSSIKAFLFILDFCTAVGNPRKIQLHYSDEREVSGLGICLPTFEAKMVQLINQMQLCIIQVIDRIASMQLGTSSRRDTRVC